MEFELSTDIKNETEFEYFTAVCLDRELSWMINGCKLSLRLDGEAPLAVWSSRQGGVVDSARGRGRGGLLTL